MKIDDMANGQNKKIKLLSYQRKLIFYFEQGSQSRTESYTNLTSGTIYFGTGQYRYTVSGLPLSYIFINIYYNNKNKSLP